MEAENDGTSDGEFLRPHLQNEKTRGVCKKVASKYRQWSLHWVPQVHCVMVPFPPKKGASHLPY